MEENTGCSLVPLGSCYLGYAADCVDILALPTAWGFWSSLESLECVQAVLQLVVLTVALTLCCKTENPHFIEVGN